MFSLFERIFRCIEADIVYLKQIIIRRFQRLGGRCFPRLLASRPSDLLTGGQKSNVAVQIRRCEPVEYHELRKPDVDTGS